MSHRRPMKDKKRALLMAQAQTRLQRQRAALQAILPAIEIHESQGEPPRVITADLDRIIRAVENA